MRSGASIPPWGHDAFPACFRFPPIFEKFSDSVENFQNFTFSEKFSDFHPPKFLMTFSLIIARKFRISPLFSLFRYISPCFAKIIISPYFEKSPPPFSKNSPAFLHTLCVFFSPTLTMMHLCITQCTYWTPLNEILHTCGVREGLGLQKGEGLC